jgi:oxygen-independent coproporphyrinogen-3 oxidase
MNYWENGEYLGLGASAWSFLDGVRRMNVAGVAGYCSSLAEKRLPSVFEERVGDEESAAEALFLGLRTEKGVDLRRFGMQHGDDRVGRVRKNMVPLLSRGLLSLSGDMLRLAGAGVFVSDEVVARLWE